MASFPILPYPSPSHRTLLFSLNSFPSDTETRDDSGLLWGGAAAPLHQTSVTVNGSPAEPCFNCGAKWFPGCTMMWHRTNTWLCGLCASENPISRTLTQTELKEYIVDYDLGPALPAFAPQHDNNHPTKLVHLYIVDASGYGSEADGKHMFDAACDAIAKSCELVPRGTWLGLAYVIHDELCLVELSVPSPACPPVTSTFLRPSDESKFTLDFDSTTMDLDRLLVSTTTNIQHAKTLLLLALTNLRSDLESGTSSSSFFRSFSGTTVPVYSTLGRATLNLARLLGGSSQVSGANLAIFSTSRSTSHPLEIDALDVLSRRASPCGVGLDVFSVDGTHLPWDKITQATGGGACFYFSMTEIMQGRVCQMAQARAACQVVFAVVVKVRTGGDMTLIPRRHGRDKHNHKAMTSTINTTIRSPWTLVKTVFTPLVSWLRSNDVFHDDAFITVNDTISPTPLFSSAGTHDNDGCVYMGVASMNETWIGFEFDFVPGRFVGDAMPARPVGGGVQIVALYTALDRESLVPRRRMRVETRVPTRSISRSVHGMWSGMDVTTTIFLLARAAFGYLDDGYNKAAVQEMVMDWAARCMACGGRDKFSSTLAIFVYGLLSCPEMIDDEQSGFTRPHWGMKLCPSDLLTYLYPRMIELKNENVVSSDVVALPLTARTNAAALIVMAVTHVIFVFRNSKEYVMDDAEMVRAASSLPGWRPETVMLVWGGGNGGGGVDEMLAKTAFECLMLDDRNNGGFHRFEEEVNNRASRYL